MLFRKFIASEHSDENLEFWQLCEEFKLLATRGGRRRSESSGGGDVPPPHHDDQQQGGQAEGGTSLLVVDEEEQELRAKARRIFNEYIANGAEKEVWVC
jgi:hypothetical protein